MNLEELEIRLRKEVSDFVMQTPATTKEVLSLIEVAKAVKQLRYKNNFDGTWVEANGWENLQQRLKDLTGDL